MESDEIEDLVIEDMSEIPTHVLEQMYFAIWAELLERGMDYDAITKH